MRKLTKRFITSSLDNLNLSMPIRYERYYISDTLRIQKKGNTYEKEILNEINENFPEFNIEEFEYKQDEIAMKKEIDKFKKSKKIHNRVIRKIKRIFKKN